jgi:hypothetical protein
MHASWNARLASKTAMHEVQIDDKNDNTVSYSIMIGWFRPLLMGLITWL